MKFKLVSNYQPTGDQPQAIKKLTQGVLSASAHQTLLGATGSGKTFSIANVIENTQLPTLVISHNKTLAAQLYQEFRDYFPNNAVSYFVSYYDYYQPEAYIPASDTYIEKEADINEEIDKLRLSSTTNLLTRPDCIVIASVSCIYNLGSPVEYGKYILEIVQGQIVSRQSILKRLTDLQYDRSDYELKRGSYRLRGDILSIWPAYTDYALKIVTLEDKIEKITPIDPLTGNPANQKNISQHYIIYPAKHYLTNPKTQGEAFSQIRADLKARLKQLKSLGKIVESYRLEQKVNFDLDSIAEFGFVNGIENYSRYFDNRNPGEPPFTLLDYFKHNAQKFHHGSFLTVIDESHMTIPQIRGMHRGDHSRKQTLIDYGFRLPAALDNRPLTIDETISRLPQIIYTSATPNEWEINKSGKTVVEQLIRPTGLLDPLIDIRPTKNQIKDLIKEIIIRTNLGQRTLVTTLTKKMAEVLTEYLNDESKVTKLLKSNRHQAKIILPKVQYLHSDVKTLDRSDILTSLRKGEYDVLVGINLLREGLDLPEVSLVAILDADKEGFLRSKTSLIQTIGRAARHQEGKVIMYADKITDSIKFALDETKRRRIIQEKYNLKHNITPISIDKPIRKELIERESIQLKKASTIMINKNESVDISTLDPSSLTPKDKQHIIKGLTKKMNQAAKEWNFELAAIIRDTIEKLS
jgi:excinuclease ABC subunit B